MLDLKYHSLSIAKKRWERREKAEGSGISLASAVGHWNRLHLQKNQIGWEWFEKTTCTTAELVMEQLFKKKIRSWRLNQSN